ncbi:MAG TPA: hypothetical protein VHW25_09595 [Steroidobacteraceae bacterium]|jgi:hypothetical protein|nr:hypothetical protein [Steroidobacteraceae bacterium]
MLHTATDEADGRLPIVVGVTGHRDLRDADLPAYRTLIVAFFEYLQGRYPATPLLVISALAEGADRLVAAIALERGYRFVVPLPLEPQDYERDFPDSVTEFRALLQRVSPQRVFVWPRPAATNDSPWCDSPAGRDHQYRAVGAFVAQQSHILLAIWDGVPNESGAGTAAVVSLKLGQSNASRAGSHTALDPDDSGPVFHVHAVRSGSEAAASPQAEWLFPHDNDPQLFHTVCSRIDRFNTEAARPRIRAQVPAAAASLLPGTAAASADRALATAFGCADRLAAHYQRITHRVLRLTLGLAALLALIFEVYAEVLPLRSVPLAYLLCFALLTLVLIWHRRMDAQGRYLDYRALAEGLRVQFYWRLGGLSDNASSSYLRKQLDELRWIREALRATGAAPPPVAAHPDLALKWWIQDQASYYATRARLHEQRLLRLERSSRVFLALGLLAAFSLVIFWQQLERLVTLHHWTVLIMGIAPIGAALLEAYGERSGARTQGNQYARFATIFRRAERFVSHFELEPATPARHHGELALLRELGREALIENADWVRLLRDRPIALPKG